MGFRLLFLLISTGFFTVYLCLVHQDTYLLPDQPDGAKIAGLTETKAEMAVFLSHKPDTVDVDTFKIDTDPVDTLHIHSDHYAALVFSHRTLKVLRDNEMLEMEKGGRLFPGDIVETCHKHYAIMEFYPGGTMILFPSSKIIFDPDGKYLSLKSAEILFEKDHTPSSFPEIIQCFEESLHRSNDTLPESFGIHCRGESGVIVTSKTGVLWWDFMSKPFKISEGSGLAGRVGTANFFEITLPARPGGLEFLSVEYSDGKDTTLNGIYRTSLRWAPDAMADNYLIHIYQNRRFTIHHILAHHHTNEFTTDILKPGTYFFRVMSIDYYGVTGDWSDPVSFVITAVNENS